MPLVLHVTTRQWEELVESCPQEHYTPSHCCQTEVSGHGESWR